MDLVGIRLGMTAEMMIFTLDSISITLSKVVILCCWIESRSSRVLEKLHLVLFRRVEMIFVFT